jgi:hypothetical protein
MWRGSSRCTAGRRCGHPRQLAGLQRVGVPCDTSGRVTELSLQDMDLHGCVPDDLSAVSVAAGAHWDQPLRPHPAVARREASRADASRPQQQRPDGADPRQPVLGREHAGVRELRTAWRAPSRTPSATRRPCGSSSSTTTTSWRAPSCPPSCG